MNTRDERRQWARVATNLIIPLAFVVLALIRVDSLDRLPTICMYRILFGIRCPGCGMTHAFCSVLHGQLLRAWDYNRLVVLAFPFFAVCAIRNAAAAARIFLSALPKPGVSRSPR
jgi:hypothetical protein